MKKSLVYLAAPYSHPDETVRLERFRQINEAASFLMRSGLHIFSPISHSHPIAVAGGLPLDWSFWKEYDEAVLSMCRALVVLMLPGWEDSKGVTEERKIAAGLCINIYRSFPDEEYLRKVAGWLTVGAKVEVVR